MKKIAYFGQFNSEAKERPMASVVSIFAVRSRPTRSSVRSNPLKGYMPTPPTPWEEKFEAAWKICDPTRVSELVESGIRGSASSMDSELLEHIIERAKEIAVDNARRETSPFNAVEEIRDWARQYGINL